jgi:hypothetical protein
MALLAAGACAVPHPNETRDYEGPSASTQSGPLAVKVNFPGGGVRLHSLQDGALYRARLTHCVDHTVPSVTLSDAATAAGGSRQLDISLSARPGGAMGFGGETNVAAIDLAGGIRLALEMDLGEGESVVDLGGLRLEGLHLKAGAGDTRVIFSQPNAGQADKILIEGTVGDVGVDLLGNAHAAVTVVRGGVGGVEVDMTGDWRRSASVEVDASVGNVLLKLPSGPGVRLAVGSPWRERLRLPGYARVGDLFANEVYERAAVVLDVRVLPGIGRLSVLTEGSAGESSR